MLVLTYNVQNDIHSILPAGDLEGRGVSMVGESVIGGIVGLEVVGSIISCILQATPGQQYQPVPHSECSPDRQYVSTEH